MRHYLHGGNIYYSMEEFLFYRVQRGDTISRIAAKFCLPPLKIIRDNYLCREVEAGDILYIEKRPNTIYTVRPSDTLDSLAERFNVTAEEILKKNGVEYLFVGLTLYI